MRFGWLTAACAALFVAPAAEAADKVIEGSFGPTSAESIRQPRYWRSGEVHFRLVTSVPVMNPSNPGLPGAHFLYVGWKFTPIEGGGSDIDYPVDFDFTQVSPTEYELSFFMPAPLPERYRGGEFAMPGWVTFNSMDAGTFTLTYGGAAYVPEPATWALMILGLGAIGAAMRRSRPALVRFQHQ